MRGFDDESGQRWQAAVVFGSFGEQRLVFSRLDGDELRTVPMQAETQRMAEAELASLTDAKLCECLHKAQPW